MKKTLIIDIKDTFALETKSAIELLNSTKYTEESFNNMTLEDIDDDGDVWLYYDTLGEQKIAKTIATLENFHINASMPIGSWVDIKEIMSVLNTKFYYKTDSDKAFLEVSKWLYKNIGCKLIRLRSGKTLKADYIYSADVGLLEKSESENKILKVMPYNNDFLDFNRVAIWSHFLRFMNEEGIGLKISEVKLNEIRE